MGKMRLVGDIADMMCRPQAAWDRILKDPPSLKDVCVGVLLPLSLLAPAATATGMLVFDTAWNAEYGYSMQADRAPFIAISTLLFEWASVFLLAAIFAILVRADGRRSGFLPALRVAVFGSIPLLLSGIALIIPAGTAVSLMATLYSLYLFHVGAQRLLGVRDVDASMFVGVAVICLFGLSMFMGVLTAALGLG